MAARDLLRRLHDAQGVFYAGGDDGPLRAVMDPDVSWYVPGRIAECRLLPFDAEAFDEIWRGPVS